jgi:hypothetical protein
VVAPAPSSKQKRLKMSGWKRIGFWKWSHLRER